MSEQTSAGRRVTQWRASRKLLGFLFVLPSVVFVLVMLVTPLCLTIWMSLHKWPLFGEIEFAGWHNYSKVLADVQFWKSLWFTTEYTLTVTPLILGTAFCLALLVKDGYRTVGFFRTAYFLPVVIGFAASSLLWVWMLNDQLGIVNRILLDLGIIDAPVVWLGQKTTALLSINLSIVWKVVGLSMIILLSGMQAISREIIEAASIDGAGSLRRITHITVPMIRRSIALVLVITVVGSYLAFDHFYIMTRGGPQNETITAVYWIFTNSFTYFKMGYGAALSMILLVMLLVLSVAQIRLLEKNQHE
jgi:multiple sugar transport system permease protein